MGGPYTEACCLSHLDNISRVAVCLGFCCCCLDVVFNLCLPHVSFIIRTQLMDIPSNIHSNLSDTPWQQNRKIALFVSSLTFLSWMTQGKEHVSFPGTYPGLSLPWNRSFDLMKNNVGDQRKTMQWLVSIVAYFWNHVWDLCHPKPHSIMEDVLSLLWEEKMERKGVSVGVISRLPAHLLPMLQHFHA